MTLILVEHDTAEPALYGAAAAILAAQRGAGLAHLPAQFDTALHPDAVQHVAASGHLVPSGLLWFERLTGRPVEAATSPGAIVDGADRADLVVPLHPAFAPSGSLAALLERDAAAAGVFVERVRVVEDAGAFTLVPLAAEPDAVSTWWRRDGFGRLAAPVKDGATRSLRELPILRIAIVGAEHDHRRVYPGALAALGDAADAVGLTLSVVFVPPTVVRPRDVAAILTTIDGLLLPGGADMANVPGQILLASAALETRKAAVGLCLGMQTMATAVARRALGPRVNLAEADPQAEVFSFTAMAEDAALVPHRLGERTMRPVAGSPLRDLLGTPPRIRCNHRFRLNPALLGDLRAAGLHVGAWDETGTIADAIGVLDHPFFVALQGHPELSSRADRPHPLLIAFLAACLAGAEPRVGGSIPDRR